MIYLFEILTDDGLYEGWANNPVHMKHKVKEQLGDVDCEVFLAGSAPKAYTLSQWREKVAGYGETKARELDGFLAEYLAIDEGEEVSDG